MSKQHRELFGENRTNSTVKEVVTKYLRKWPLFLGCLLVCIGTGVFYTRYTVPKYLAYTFFLVKGAENGKASEDLIEGALNGKKTINLNNDIMLIKSSGLMERLVAKKNLNVLYYKKGNLLDINIYKDAPFRLVSLEITDSNRTYSLYVKTINAKGGMFLSTDRKEKKYTFFWDIPFVINGQRFKFTSEGPVSKEDGEYLVYWKPVQTVAAELSRQLFANPLDPKTSVIQLSLKTENIQMGKDVLNTLFSEFNLADIEERNKLSENTVQFIDERLVTISRELKGVEGNLENYQGDNQLVDIKGQSTQSLENSNEVSRIIKELSIQQGIVEMILAYFVNPANTNKLVPSSLGLNDPTLASLITQYNELQLKKEREAPLVAANSIVMQDLHTQLNNLKGSILESLSNLNKNLKLQESGFRQQNSQYRNFLSAVPRNERVLQEIRRKQSITEGLYLYLLQKREEAAISSTSSNVPSYKQIDAAKGYGPVEPNRSNIILYTALLGFCLAFGFIYFQDVFNDKIKSRQEISALSSIPIVGEITHLPKSKVSIKSILTRSMAGEQFRAIRTNLFFNNQGKKVLLVTSSIGSEGKSFVSLNLACVLALPGKKVALLEFDLRKPNILKEIDVKDGDGITNYLNDPQVDLAELRTMVPEVPSLHIYPAGPIPSNTGDLLLSERLQQLFATLIQEYDYVVIDSPPASLVSDAFVLGKYSDVVLYVLRQGLTPKKHLAFANEIVEKNKFQNMGFVLNDVKNRSQNEYYSYGRNRNGGENVKSNSKNFHETKKVLFTRFTSNFF